MLKRHCAADCQHVHAGGGDRQGPASASTRDLEKPAGLLEIATAAAWASWCTIADVMCRVSLGPYDLGHLRACSIRNGGCISGVKFFEASARMRSWDRCLPLLALGTGLVGTFTKVATSRLVCKG